jgi:putative SOS response-associated peptidase YedK
LFDLRREALKIWPVGKAVGNVKNNGPELVALAV